MMKKQFNRLIFLCFLFSFIRVAYAVEALPPNLIAFTSPAGLALLKRDNLNENALKLLSHFTTQKTVSYCGIASVVMVLNSTSLLPPLDVQHVPYHYFNQDNFFNEAVKKIVSPEEVRQKGVSLRKLRDIIQSYGLEAELYSANDLSLDIFRHKIRAAIAKRQFVIVNFLRKELGQEGGGHHSPLAAYDEKTDRFLLLDVARYKYPAYWVKTEDLWRAVHTLDEGAYRGFIII